MRPNCRCHDLVIWVCPSTLSTPEDVRMLVKHPVFARVYDRMSVGAENAGAADHRDRMLADLVGSVVEVGAGTGLNFRHYPSTVVDVTAIEPEPYLRARAESAAEQSGVAIRVLDGTADALPLASSSVDAGVASLVLCSVANPDQALLELHRVIRPGGELRFYEHVGATQPRWARFQRRADPIWSRFGGGCHLTRDTERAIVAAGFEIESCDHFLFQPSWTAKLAAPHILGRARRSAT